MLDNSTQNGVIPARYIAHLAGVMQQQQVDVPALMAHANIHPKTLLNPEAWLTFTQLDALVPKAIEVSGRSDLAVELGKTIRLSTHNIVGYGILSSPSIGYALQLAARHFSLILPPFRMRISREGAHAMVQYEPTQSMQESTFAFLLEILAVATHRDLEELLGHTIPSAELHFSINAPPHVRCYAELLKATAHFADNAYLQQRPGLTLRFPAELLSCKPVLADPSALRVAEERCRTLMQRSVSAGNVGAWVKMMLQESHGSMPDLSELARSQNLSPRTLDRYLKREGVGFRELLKQARHNKACKLLKESTLDITQIAYELGYNDAANFTRAFRREAGMPPSQYRALPDTSAIPLPRTT